MAGATAPNSNVSAAVTASPNLTHRAHTQLTFGQCVRMQRRLTVRH